MTAKLSEIIAFARQAERLFPSVDPDEIIETVDRWHGAMHGAPAPSEPKPSRGWINRITAQCLRPGIEADISDGWMRTDERRRLVLGAARSLKTGSGAAIGANLFDLERLSRSERSDVARAINDDVAFHERMSALPDRSKANGPAEDLLMPDGKL